VARRKLTPRKEAGGDVETRRRGRALREQYPATFLFGEGKIRPLSHEEAIAATPHERIRSVWPFLVRSVLKFADTLRPRDLANYDPEDVLLELYATLLEKDDKWEPERGKYLTFAGSVVENELHAIRDRSHTVHSPRNSSCRLKQYEQAQAEGKLDKRKERTFASIRRVIGEHESIEGEASLPAAKDTAEVVLRREELKSVNSAVLAGLMMLTIEEADILGRSYGLWGSRELPLDKIAERTRRTLDSVKKIKARAQDKIRARLAESGLPLADAG
jgi:DNA-directed RNA polymerase specialized sigma subunit